MEQRPSRRGHRRYRWKGSIGTTLLLGLLLILGFAWGAIAGDPGNSISLAHGKEPTAATNADGEVLVLWESAEGGVSGQLIDPWGLIMGEEFPISGLAGDERQPAVTWLDNQEVAIVWESEDPAPGAAQGSRPGTSVRYRQFRRGLAGSELLVPSTSEVEIPNAAHPAVAASDGSIALVWTAARSRRGQHYLRILETEPETSLSRGLAGSELRIGSPGAVTPADVAIAGDGEILVVWEDANREIMAFAMNARGLAGSEFKVRGLAGSEFRISQSRGTQMTAPAVATTLDGNFLVTWETLLSNGERIVSGRRVVARGLAGSEFRIDSGLSGEAKNPSLAADSWGQQIVTWKQVIGSEAAIMARAIHLDGTANGAAFRVDPGDPFPGAVRVTRGGQNNDFIVLWEDDEKSEAPDIRIRFLTGPYDFGEDEK